MHVVARREKKFSSKKRSMFVLRMLLKKQFVMADARVAESQAERVAQARVRAARLTDLPFLLAGAAEQGAIAARGDAMVNNNDFFSRHGLYV